MNARRREWKGSGVRAPKKTVRGGKKGKKTSIRKKNGSHSEVATGS